MTDKSKKDEKEVISLFDQAKAIEDSTKDISKQILALEQKRDSILISAVELRKKAEDLCPHYEFSQAEWHYTDPEYPVDFKCNVCSFVKCVPPSTMPRHK